MHICTYAHMYICTYGPVPRSLYNGALHLNLKKPVNSQGVTYIGFLSFGGRSAPCANAGCQRIWNFFFASRLLELSRVSLPCVNCNCLSPSPALRSVLHVPPVCRPAGWPANSPQPAPQCLAAVQCLDRVPVQVMYRVSLQPVHRVSLNFRMVLSFRPAVKTHAGHGDKFSTKTTARQRPKILKMCSKPMGHRKHDRTTNDCLEQTSL